jgi:hypothetical protein
MSEIETLSLSKEVVKALYDYLSNGITSKSNMELIQSEAMDEFRMILNIEKRIY